MIISSHTSTSQFASFSHGHGASTQFQRSVVLDWLGRIGPYFSTYIFSAFCFISRCFRYCSIARLQFGCVSRYNCNSYSIKSHCCRLRNSNSCSRMPFTSRTKWFVQLRENRSLRKSFLR